MLKINFEPPEDESWKRWRKKCDRATAKVIKEYTRSGKVTINEKLYKELKEYIYRKEDGQFHGKCAYCEQKISGNQHVDIDHFRPKKMVADEKDNIVFINKTKNEKHPGYYWLAYEWTNLLPSCVLCNQPNTSAGQKIGKRNRFPVSGKHAVKPGQEKQEKPLLINPLFEDPKLHLRLVADTGVLEAISPEGQMCIDVFGLNDRGLPGDRAKIYRSVEDSYGVLIADIHRKRDVSERLSSLAKMWRGEEHLSLAGKTAIEDSDKLFKGLIVEQLERLSA